MNTQINFDQIQLNNVINVWKGHDCGKDYVVMKVNMTFSSNDGDTTYTRTLYINWADGLLFDLSNGSCNAPYGDSFWRVHVPLYLDQSYNTWTSGIGNAMKNQDLNYIEGAINFMLANEECYYEDAH